MAGGNDDSNSIPIVSPSTPQTFQGGNTAAIQVPATSGASTPANAYYIKIVAAASQGGQIVNYSDRFTISGMTGSFPPAIAKAIPGGTAGPTNQDQVSNNANPAAGADGSVTPYAEQTGLTKYAPMVGLPPTKISAPKNPTPLNPTSAFTIAKTALPIPTSPMTTITASNTFSVSSIENTAAPAAAPSDDMAKFLNRWKD
ncbi:MAG: hypothetical protein M1822_004928 [Bathelium mastoideum]|nr:MAG: hypothetical protein M1822_004928 [Bathelium mastoideum]